jgi:dihydroflavonol-4-reductase
VADYYTVNQQGTASLFKSLHAQKIYPKKIICLSSIAAAGPSLDGSPVQESNPPHPITAYAKSKLMGEAEALKFKEVYPIIILRAPAVIGPRDKDMLIYFRWIKQGALLALGSKQRYMSLCYIKDLVRAFFLCSQKELESGEIFNIADPNRYSYEELGVLAGQAMGKKLRKVIIPISIGYLVALIGEIGSRISKKPSVINLEKFKRLNQRSWIVDMEKTRDKLSFKPQYSLREAIQETISWYLEHNWL